MSARKVIAYIIAGLSTLGIAYIIGYGLVQPENLTAYDIFGVLGVGLCAIALMFLVAWALSVTIDELLS